MGGSAWLTTLSALDVAALALLLAAWFGASWWIERGPRAGMSISAIMNEKRAVWMRRAAERDQRIVDAALLTALQNGAAFFASATLLAAGGALALIAETDQIVRVARDLPLSEAPPSIAAFEAKLLVTLILLVNAFLKFAWAQRLFSYCAVLIGAIPNQPTPPQPLTAEHQAEAARAAAVLAQAGVSFNRGLRTLYYALASLAWLIGPLALTVAIAVISTVIWRREFRSKGRDAMM
ncbi:MAG: DUF599 family protein [Pseudomonadota bacterium]